MEKFRHKRNATRHYDPRGVKEFIVQERLQLSKSEGNIFSRKKKIVAPDKAETGDIDEGGTKNIKP